MSLIFKKIFMRNNLQQQKKSSDKKEKRSDDKNHDTKNSIGSPSSRRLRWYEKFSFDK